MFICHVYAMYILCIYSSFGKFQCISLLFIWLKYQVSSSSMAVAGWFTLGKSWLSQFLSVPSPWINRMDLQIVSFFRFSIRFYAQRVFDGILMCNPTKNSDGSTSRRNFAWPFQIGIPFEHLLIGDFPNIYPMVNKHRP